MYPLGKYIRVNSKDNIKSTSIDLGLSIGMTIGIILRLRTSIGLFLRMFISLGLTLEPFIGKKSFCRLAPETPILLTIDLGYELLRSQDIAAKFVKCILPSGVKFFEDRNPR